MVRRARGAWRIARCAGFVVLAAGIGAPAASAQDDGAPAAVSRLRPADPRASALLREGYSRSATFRLLVEAVEQSDLIVHVETCPLSLPGQLEFAVATPARRYLRVSVRAMNVDDDVLPWLAHELWHAVEIARAPEVRDGASLLRFYERIGGGFRADGRILMETVEAQQVQFTVLSELRSGRPRAPAPR
jgi:hypothetical protein